VEAIAPRRCAAPPHDPSRSRADEADRCTWSGLEDLRPQVRAAVAHRCRGRCVEVDDVVQEALLRAARYRHSLIDPERLRAWVVRIGLNVLRDQMRRELRLPRVEKPDEVFDLLEGREEIPGDPPDDDALEAEGLVFERQVVLRHLDLAIEELPRGDRRVLDAFYERVDATRRASCVRETGPELFKVQVFRARGRLARALRKRLALGAHADVAAQPPMHHRSASCAPVRSRSMQSGTAAGDPQ
jgi:RNA polymerase sigma factor (sigma-70 family)